MNFAVVFEPVSEPGFPAGYFYAHVPSLGLTTHGEGVAGARAAVKELAELWVAEKQANAEPIPVSTEFLVSTLEISDHALQSA